MARPPGRASVRCGIGFPEVRVGSCDGECPGEGGPGERCGPVGASRIALRRRVPESAATTLTWAVVPASARPSGRSVDPPPARSGFWHGPFSPPREDGPWHVLVSSSN
ncbi:hypothetical protein GCM10020221_11090 [Streptomyces thioluteus]|uniref:Uncharacterized protein n=1 Tax=Streptomyces thioluteus TaxID=66431 RepID=A0ABP6J188_STRTU